MKPIEHDFGGSGALTRPTHRDLGPLRGHLGSSAALTGPMDRDVGGVETLAKPIDRDFGALRGVLGSLLTTFLRPRRLQSSQIWCSELSAI